MRELELAQKLTRSQQLELAEALERSQQLEQAPMLLLKELRLRQQLEEALERSQQLEEALERALAKKQWRALGGRTLERVLDRALGRPETGELKLKRALGLAHEIVVDLELLNGDSTSSAPTALEISIEIPNDLPPDKLKEFIRQAVSSADAVHRSRGGHGLQIDTVECFEDSRVPEGVK